MEGQPLFRYTQNLHLGHCLNFAPLAKLTKDWSSGFMPLYSRYSLQVNPWCCSVLHFRQQFLKQFLQWQSVMEESASNSAWHPGVGHQEVVSPFLSTYWFIMKSSYFFCSSVDMKLSISWLSISMPQNQEGHRTASMPFSMLVLTWVQRHSQWKTWVQSRIMADSLSMSISQIEHQFSAKLRLMIISCLWLQGCEVRERLAKQQGSSKTFCKRDSRCWLKADSTWVQFLGLGRLWAWMAALQMALTMLLLEIISEFTQCSQSSMASTIFVHLDIGIPSLPSTKAFIIRAASLAEQLLTISLSSCQSLGYTYSSISLLYLRLRGYYRSQL